MNTQLFRARLGHRCLSVLATAALSLTAILPTAHAAQLSLANMPLFDSVSAPPLNMLVLGRDHKLFMGAYNDASDLNGDGLLDVGYKGYLSADKGGIDYFGYFSSIVCYTYNAGVFVPSALANSSDKSCDGNSWSGDFLNYVTTSRIDALRKVLYGGYRSTDTATTTILERAYIPQDAHSFGKEYQSQARDGYDIRKYTPLSQPGDGKYILFANTTLTSSVPGASATNPIAPPLMRVLEGSTSRIWEWLSKEGPVAGDNCAVPNDNLLGWKGAPCTGTRKDYTARVQVCVANYDQDSCKQYPNGSYKPVGLLHQYGENDSMYFGLLSGSYTHNFQGGVVRKEVTSFKDEVDLNTGIFVNPKKGLIASLDGFKIEDSTTVGTNNSYSHDRSCPNPAGWWNPNPADGTCRIWGNPVGEMMFESLRYFAGASGANPAYTYTNAGSDDAALLLPQVTTWKDPYKSVATGGQGYPTCAKPVDTIISDVNTSRDSELPGNPWSAVSIASPSTLTAFNANTLGQKMWNAEFGASASKNIFIGEVGASADGMPTTKTATSFGNIRGLSPEEPTRQGTYYAAEAAFYGHTTDLNPAANKQLLNTYSVALSSPIPRMEIPVNGKTITLVPLGKVVCSSYLTGNNTCTNLANGTKKSTGPWQATEQIVAFYIEEMANMPGQPVDNGKNGGRPIMVFRINFEDAEQGSDYDMDEIVKYTLVVNAAGGLDVSLATEFAAAGWESHMGYVISGTDHDGVYFETAGGGSENTHYTFDTPAGVWANGCALNPANCQLLPGTGSASKKRTFALGANAAATLLNDPLWYAAKFGGFVDANKDNLPQSTEWDSKVKGSPDNYFLVTNALTLAQQMKDAFDDILQHNSSASTAAVNSGAVSSDSRVYQAVFNSGDWLGHLLSIPVNPDGSLKDDAEWDAADKLPVPSNRNILTLNSDGKVAAFTTAALDSTRKGQLGSTTILQNWRIDYVRGDDTNEQSNGGIFRNRATKLGDIVNSSPVYTGAPSELYNDNLESPAYSKFRQSNIKRAPMVYTGANDGMLHAFDAKTGEEEFAYIPTPVFGNLRKLTSTSYNHLFYVDSTPTVQDAFFSGDWHTVLVGGLGAGGQGIYALDVTDPTKFGSSKVLWEFTDGTGAGKGVISGDSDADLGYTFSRPTIARMHNGSWVAIFGNGYNNSSADGKASSTGRAYLYIVDIRDGSLLRKIDTGVGSTGTPNGLATPAVIDNDGDGIADYVYAGDLQGNLWKFDITSSNSSNWKVAYNTTGAPTPLYVAKDAAGNAQPITSSPDVSVGPHGQGLMVYFGTGKWLEDPTDRLDNATVTLPANQRVQTMYGILDPNTGANADAFTGRNQLAHQSITDEVTVSSGASVRASTSHDIGTRGWYMDLILNPTEALTPPSANYKGERVASDVLYRNGRIIFTTLIPQSDPCTFGGDSWIMELNALNGGRLSESPFDVNKDGVIDANDYIVINGVAYPVSGIKSDVGIVAGVGVLQQLGTKLENKYAAGTSGEIDVVLESSIGAGQQSWIQKK